MNKYRQVTLGVHQGHECYMTVAVRPDPDTTAGPFAPYRQATDWCVAIAVRVNEKTHNFWAFTKFIHRLACVCEEYGISLEVESEAWTSQTCPECGDREGTVRHGDTLTCPCGFEGHADLTASETFLRENNDMEARPMARPVRFEWDDHDWSESPRSHESPKEVRTNPQVASVGR